MTSAALPVIGATLPSIGATLPSSPAKVSTLLMVPGNLIWRLVPANSAATGVSWSGAALVRVTASSSQAFFWMVLLVAAPEVCLCLLGAEVPSWQSDPSWLQKCPRWKVVLTPPPGTLSQESQ